MSAESSFDIISKIDMQELKNAIQQAEREIETRFDFKGSKSDISIDKDDLVVVSDSEIRVESVVDILQSKMIKRGISLKCLEYGKIEPAASNAMRQRIKLKQGVDQDNSKKINQLIKESNLKVKTVIQGDQIRVTGKSKDDLQKVMQLLKSADLTVDVQFANYR